MNKPTEIESDDVVTDDDEPVLTGTMESSDEITMENLTTDYQHLIPKMNVSVVEPQQIEEVPPENLISNERLLGVYDEILNLMRDEHKQVTNYIDDFAEMVINGGDSTTSSKESLVNLLKIRCDIPDKMSKIADLMTRVKMKERDTYKPYLNANQTNNVVINENTGGSDMRTLLDNIKKTKKKDKK